MPKGDDNMKKKVLAWLVLGTVAIVGMLFIFNLVNLLLNSPLS